MPVTGFAELGDGRFVLVGPRGIAVTDPRRPLTSIPERTNHGHCPYQSRRDAGRPRTCGIRPALRQQARAPRVQPPAGDGHRLHARHDRAGLLRGNEARAGRELREDDSAEPAVHQELPHLSEGPARARQCHSRGGRERRRRHLRSPVPRRVAADQRRADPDAGCGSCLGQVAVDGQRALDRGHRGRLPWRPGDAGFVRWLGAERRAAEAEHRPLGDRRQPRRQQLQVDDDLRSTPRQGDGHGQADGLPRALARARGQDPRQIRAREVARRHSQEQAVADGPDPRDRVRQADRRSDRRPAQGDGVLRRRRADRHRHHLRLHPLRPEHRAGCRLLDRRRDLAARAHRAAGFRARPVLDPGAIPRVRDRRLARRTEDERHHAGHRPWHAPARGGSLHVPPPVPRRTDGAPRGRSGLRRPDGDRHSGHQGAGA